MPKLDISATFPFTQDEAKQRLGPVLTKYADVANANVAWTSPSQATLEGKRANGTLTLNEGMLAMSLTLSLLLLPMKSQIRNRIIAELTAAGFTVASS